jgi:hypothetical protein
MRRILYLVVQSLIAIELASSPKLFGDEKGVRAEISSSAITRARTDDPAVASFKLSLRIRLTNGSPRILFAPSLDADDKVTQIAILGAELLQTDGQWKRLFSASWYDSGQIRYAPCSPLVPGRKIDLFNVDGGFVLLRKQLVGLSERSTIRVNIMTFCRQPDGKLLTKEVTSEGFEAQLGDRP